MREWEKELSPLIKEKLARIGEITSEEREVMKDFERLDSLLSEFYKGQLDAEGLWRRLKEYKEQGRASLLKEAQLKLIDSLNLGSIAAEFQKRRDGILAIETLKESQNTSMLESTLNLIEGLQRRYKEELQQAYGNLKAQVEGNPQLRAQQVKQGQMTVVMQLTVDEAIKNNPQWKASLANHEKRYNQEFARVIEKVREEVKHN